jgi:hypothetical protein
VIYRVRAARSRWFDRHTPQALARREICFAHRGAPRRRARTGLSSRLSFGGAAIGAARQRYGVIYADAPARFAPYKREGELK